MIQRIVGKQAPNFEIEAVKPKREIEKISLEDYTSDDRWVILFFYQMDFSPICSTEIISISEQYHAFEKLDTEVIGISTDTLHAHEVWIEQLRLKNGIENLHFPLAADTNHVVSKNYGVLIEDKGIALRGLFIIHPNGEVQYQSIFHENVGRNIDEILRVLEALQTNNKCPANWKPGDKAL